MTYIAQSLGRNEQLHYRAGFPAIRYAAAWSLFVLLLSGAGVAAIDNVVWAAAILALMGVGLTVSIMLPVWTTEIGVTTQRLIYKRGLLWRATKELQLRAIEEVNLEQGLLGRIFNYGRIDLHGTGVDDIRLPTLADPVTLQRAIQEMIGAAVQTASGALAAPSISPHDPGKLPLLASTN